jgi:NAD(P)-dependent dehydrogenase (short-subunit alcohol dehydrogenase family)
LPGLLQNHIAVVTGAASGIGRAIALGYAREGAQVVLLDLHEKAAAEAVQDIRAAGGKAESFALDVSRREDCIAVAKRVADTAAELGKDGVRVNAIGPGLIETPLNATVRANDPGLVKIFLDHTPLGRAGQPEDIVGPAIFLASDLSSYVTGSIVMADGGYRAI